MLEDTNSLDAAHMMLGQHNDLLDQSLRCELLTGNQSSCGHRRPTLIRLCGCPDWSVSRDLNQVIFLFLLYHMANLTSPVTYGHGGVGYYMYMYWFGCYIRNFLALFVMRSWLRNAFSMNYQTKKYSRIKIFFIYKGLYSRTVLSTTNKQSTVSTPRSFIISWRLIFLSLFIWSLAGMAYKMESILK